MSDETKEAKLHEIRSKIKDFSQAKANRIYLTEFRKSKLAMLMKKYQTHYDAANAQEREARQDPEYIELLEGLKAATEVEERLHWELRILEMEFEAWRTRQANKRAEKSRYGG